MADGLDFKVRVVILPPALNSYVEQPTNPPMQDAHEAARDIERRAAAKVGTKYSGTTGKPERARTKGLAESGRVESEGKGSWTVIFEHDAAEVHHQGAPSHSYDEKKWYANPNPGTWKGGTKRFRKFGPFTHPGHSANPFLVEAAAEVARRSGSLKRGTTGPFPTFRTRSPGFFT